MCGRQLVRSVVVAAVGLGLIVPSALPAEAGKRDSLRLPNPTAAMIRSWLFPGWGQWYNGRKWKAAVFFTAEAGLIGYAVWENRRAAESTTEEERFQHQDRRNLALWWLAGAALLSGLEAYVDAHLAGFDVSSDLSLSPLPEAAACLRITVRLDRIGRPRSGG
jgi:hypothetical protein